MGKKEQDPKDIEVNEELQEDTQVDVENTDNEEVSKKSKKKSGSKSKKLASELADAEAEVAELKDKYLRLLAEFENFKKRTFREKLETMKTAAQDTVSALLPVLDDFDRAKKTAEDESSTEQFSEGVTLVYQKLNNILNQKGLEAMESTGLDFDPELHEAITEIPAPSPDLVGKVVDTIETGYTLKEKIIRHAKVVVGK